MQILNDRVVFVSERKTQDLRWGYYQFPGLFYGLDGNIYLFIQANLDAFDAKGEPAEQPYFYSKNGGKTFEKVSEEQWMKNCKTAHFSYKIEDAYYSFVNNYGLRSSTVGTPTLTEQPLVCGYGEQQFHLHPFSALPQEEKTVNLCKMQKGSLEVIKGEVQGVEMLRSLYSEYNYTIDETKYYQNFLALVYTSLMRSGKDLFCVVTEPIYHDKYLRNRLNILKSETEGKSWQKISSIYPPENSRWGFMDEASIIETNAGKFVLVIRMLASHDVNDTHYLACFVSEDRGKTWVEQPPLSQFSVRPKLLKGKTEIAVVYGRPGIYYRTSKDGLTWSESVAIIGPSEKELENPITQEVWDREFIKYSCANASVLPLKNEGEYLLAYSDFRYALQDGYHKAIRLVNLKLD